MFVQIHMLQSMPPGNLNRDETGQPKKCIFGGVTRSRISSQCLKRNIRWSKEFEDVFGDDLSVNTTYLPRMVEDELRKLKPGISDDDLKKIKIALAAKFKGETAKGETEDAENGEELQDKAQKSSGKSGDTDQTGQLVRFPPPFAQSVAELITALPEKVYNAWIRGKKKDKEEHKKEIKEFEDKILKKSKSLTVDIGLFGRMTTSDLVVNVEAACQVAHAISTHETVIESDYFTAVDDKKLEFASTQTEKAGAAFIGSGETEIFYNSAVYYKYFNLDVDALKKHLSWQDEEAARAAGAFLLAAARGNPSGKQNSFAAHGVPELILVEMSKTKHPISYANAFLRPVEGLNLMSESAASLREYVESVVAAFEPPDVRRVVLAVGSASVDIPKAQRMDSLDNLADSVVRLLNGGAA
jgi:CRISPR system Cascade subunit CasC